MVEEYRDSISEKDEKKESAVDKIRKIMKGKITAPQLDWKKVKEERISKK